MPTLTLPFSRRVSVLQPAGWDARQAAHLLRRAGFGGTPAEIQAAVQQGKAAAVDALLNVEQIPDDVDERAKAAGIDIADLPPRDRGRFADLQRWWLFRMAYGKRPLEEKLTLFWHNHFATGSSKVNNPKAMYDQNQLFRQYALGNFRELTQAVAKDPAMIQWLDNNTNRKGNPNENFARELFELFTLGIGNYTEQDVKEAARAFTGWFARPDTGFTFQRNQHDDGQKSVLGHIGNYNGDDVVDFAVRHPATARFLTTKLWSWFAYEDPEPALISRLADRFAASDYDVKGLMRDILLSDEFYSDKAQRALIKNPVEFTVGLVRGLGIQTDFKDVQQPLSRMGMTLFNPPNVAGWPGGATWINAGTLLERLNLVNRLVTNRGKNGTALDIDGLARESGGTASGLVDGVLSRVIGPDAPQEQRATLLKYLGADRAADKPLDSATLDQKGRGLVYLALSLPHNHLS